ncbi:transglutaminase-like domain-containing protein [Stratiformator vulcanicus]|uniref:Transglutaminase-like superfamily protein n=1 Tax=Stratiformator vulcanicus TaxID=2527980 RepID=A0A517QYI3_9PLAN|nr:transglutaminase domain-containing protein [Stratiformator vulcanicus]QDT36653.1 Transglutaminase-like superfamily protein [Stratiformator vulcanicus]
MHKNTEKQRERSLIESTSVPTTIGLSLLACGILTVASGEDHHQWWTYGELALQTAITIAAAIWVGRKASKWERPPAVAPILLLLAILTIACEPIHRLCGAGRPGEIVVMDALKHVVLGLAAVSHWLVFRRMAAFLSLFLMMFAVSLTVDPRIQIMAGIFSAIAIFWAAVTYWEGLQEQIVAKTESRMPRWWLGGLGAFVVLLLATVSVGGDRALNSLKGFFPSSGGDGWYDPAARDGVRDGDAVVAGTKDIKSFAPIEDAPFMIDDRPTLYDVFDDSYQEPYPNKKQDRAIGLTQDFEMNRCQERLAALKKAGKEFSTFRKPQSQKENDRLSDRDGGALFYVVGRTPLHLRMCAHDLFDGEVWVHEEGNAGHFSIEVVDGKPWAVPPLPPPNLAVFGGVEGHTLKIIDLDSAVIPAPGNLRGVHIDQVNRGDFFEIVHADIPAMDREVLPPLTTINIVSELIDSSKVVGQWNRSTSAGPSYQQWPDHPDWDRIKKLAGECAGDAAFGVEQVKAVTDFFKANYRFERGVGTDKNFADPVHDHNDHSHAGHEHAHHDHDHQGHQHTDEPLPVSCFLFETKVGDDYHFATATALMLRSLGYSTRLVQGFYADPADYDPKARNTPIRTDDVHTWVEVYLGTGIWMTVEPTPGYEILGPPPTLFDHAKEAAVTAAIFVGSHPWPFASGLIVLILLWVYRLDLVDAADSAAFRLRFRHNDRQRLLAAANLLERRAVRAGLTRPPGMTLRMWLRSIFEAETREQADRLTAFLIARDRAAFGSINDARLPLGELNSLLGEMSLSQLRRTRRHRSRNATEKMDVNNLMELSGGLRPA